MLLDLIVSEKFPAKNEDNSEVASGRKRQHFFKGPSPGNWFHLLLSLEHQELASTYPMAKVSIY
jgi:hypothetical protein